LKSIRTIAPLVVTLAWTLGATSIPARSEECGKRVDTSAIEAIIYAKEKLDRTWISSIAVVGNYAEADVGIKGVWQAHFVRRNGWQLTNDPIPPSIQAAIVKLQSAHEGEGCTNPDGIIHPSG